MKIVTVAALTLALIATPAFALRVTNLDTIPQTVALVVGTQADQRTIQPGETEYFTGNSNGRLSLVEVPAPTKKGKTKKKSSSKDDTTVHADGILSGIIGAERSENIPVDPDSDYTIWPGGKLSLQSNHRRGTGSQF